MLSKTSGKEDFLEDVVHILFGKCQWSERFTFFVQSSDSPVSMDTLSFQILMMIVLFLLIYQT